jgi:ABC-type sugar transport system ATPase subunit
MQQLVCIARALVRKPRILILDEPTSVLTETETEKLMEILGELKQEGISCIYISHKLDEVFQISDRMIILRDGELISEYFQQEEYNSTRVIEDMIGRKINVMYPKVDRIIGKTVLRVENFKVPHPFAYGKSIIEDVSFDLKKGEILGLVGLVGSGRSELVNAIFGAIPKSAGKLYLNDKEIKINNPQDAKKYGLGLVTEDRKRNGFIGTMSVCHNMTLAILDLIRSFIFVDKKKEKTIADEYFNTLRIKAPNLSTIITNLSGGNQQKVIIAKWLMTNLKIILLDEPTRGIDVGTKADIYRLVQDLASKGISIIMISSELPELLGVCDRFVVLGKGVVQAEFDKQNASQVELLRAASNT